MYVIGTAGHVDHGKSTLVRALTGIDPDRLAEEKARAMTIDLGFAWLTLPDLPEEVGVVDVPGHRDFIENMLAGVGGIDLALFVVAADEGVMPQTREHLAILDLLQLPRGVIAITKADLIDDPDWLELVELDIAEVVEGTVLADAPMIAVSAETGHNIPLLKETLSAQLQADAPRADTGQPRLPIDRVFSLSGFGTVVTGTLSGGQLRLGDDVVIQPDGLSGRVRGLQTHNTKRDVAQPGSRVAVNVTGVGRDDVRRGMVLTHGDGVRGTVLIDVAYRHLPDADKPLRHNKEVKLFIGSAETIARTRIIGQKEIAPGTSGWLQLALREPVACARGDRFILRRPSPPATVGGGRILDPHPGRQHRRFRPQSVERLRTLAEGTPAELLVQALARIEPATEEALRQRAGLADAAFDSALRAATAAGTVVALDKALVTIATRQRWLNQIEAWLADYHTAYPLRQGMSREEARSRLKLKSAVFTPLLTEAVAAGRLVEADALLHLPGHTVVFPAVLQAQIDALLATFARSGINAPSVKDARTAVGDEGYQALLTQGTLVQIAPDVVWLASDYGKFTQIIHNYLRENQAITAAQVRDLFATSRKYAIALLEHLDEIRVTRREGDARVLR